MRKLFRDRLNSHRLPRATAFVSPFNWKFPRATASIDEDRQIPWKRYAKDIPSDRWHNYFNRARPFVSLSGVSRSSTSPRVLLGEDATGPLARSRARTHTHTHTVHPFSALPAKEEKKRGDKGLTYRSVTRYPTNDSFFFFPLFSPVMHARKTEQRHAETALSSRQNEIIKITRLSPVPESPRLQIMSKTGGKYRL